MKIVYIRHGFKLRHLALTALVCIAITFYATRAYTQEEYMGHGKMALEMK